ncbi:MAG: hypothetical protein KGK01_07860 [Bradyrhizobium sp.]|uniref:hypothetical protein n=1 Tax=Bradyrhizobium sp. TaxID=376 RepID=UPI001C291ADA|nr:hypothetical protein [Bradyrhizobium sp.]MBU6463415.1 hypothetical protein [Pseudomonadota bacterium]MDE2067097.1 hypothetical protein [Bradyrhizobium sp.]MDE2242344.1 hypothetical protein [Bradyrhizobium sp.]MDE2468761.1 hypothetical protein [Bradyrhizobium sp.]
MSEPTDSELTTIFIVLNEDSPAEHGVRVGTVNLSPEDERMQELIGTPQVYGIVQAALTAGGETVGARSCFAFIPATDEERKAWEQERLGSPEGVYFLPYISQSPDQGSLS